MDNSTGYLAGQYQLVIGSRNVVMEFCHKLDDKIFVKLNSFNDKSISDLLVHVTHVYTFWLGKFSLKKDVAFAGPDEIKSLSALQQLFENVNELVTEYLRYIHQTSIKEFSGEAGTPAKVITRSPFEIFTHVITHEFHHKGQILNMGRQLGLVPPDTDIIRF
jgi:uncharacterized damage-inducible protein DinB